ncbi:ABC transporter permease [Flexithrix dorotheae]|uniref:ABC transporter permease n=1 Tax=Flexithrix dorotheae TaxID=70993 RepID=UPI0003799F0E|nr:ABC transporter permease [Flexithrix dorotheae]
MLKNYFIVSWRNLWRSKLFSFINITGLSLGIAGSLLIALHVWDELHFDQFHEKKEAIFQVGTMYKGKSYSRTSPPLAGFIRSNFPEVKNVVRYYKKDCVVKIPGLINDPFNESVYFADPGFFELFSFPFVSGNAQKALNNPYEIIITEKYANKYFGEEEALGKVITVKSEGWDKSHDFTITGIVADIPGNSSLQFELLLSLSFLEKIDRTFEPGEKWFTLGPNTFMESEDNVNLKEFAIKLEALVNENLSQNSKIKRSYKIEPFTDLHFSDTHQKYFKTSNIQYLFILGALGLIILIVACINFTTLSISKSSVRAKEVGVRKTMGAQKVQLIIQFLGESFIMTFLAAIIGLIFLSMALPVFNDLVGKQLYISAIFQKSLSIWLGLILFVTAILSGGYPALIISNYKPDINLRGRFKALGKNQLISILATLQFIVSAILITSTLIMNAQLQQVFQKKLGFDENLVIRISVPFSEGEKLLQLYQNQLANEPEVKSVSGTWEHFSGETGVSFNDFEFLIDGQSIRGKTMTVAPNFIETLRIPIVAGRHTLIPLNGGEKPMGIIVNEKFIKEFGLTDAIGKTVECPQGSVLLGHFEKATIVGVVKDFNYQSLYKEIEPLVLQAGQVYSNLYVRINAEKIPEGLELLQDNWKEIAPDLPFDYNFLDEDIQNQYQADLKWLKIGFYASVVAIIIACLGLFGLATYTSNQRVKEIGIRKILGASISSILILLSKTYLKLVLVAIVIAIPISNYFIIEWLNSFAYKIEVKWWHFALSGGIIICIALFTVSGQSLKASSTNPVDNLRNE